MILAESSLLPREAPALQDLASRVGCQLTGLECHPEVFRLDWTVALSDLQRVPRRQPRALDYALMRHGAACRGDVDNHRSAPGDVDLVAPLPTTAFSGRGPSGRHPPRTRCAMLVLNPAVILSSPRIRSPELGQMPANALERIASRSTHGLTVT